MEPSYEAAKAHMNRLNNVGWQSWLEEWKRNEG